MVKITEVFVKSMDAREILVQVAEVVLAELAGFISLRLEGRGEGDGLVRQPDVGARLADMMP